MHSIADGRPTPACRAARDRILAVTAVMLIAAACASAPTPVAPPTIAVTPSGSRTPVGVIAIGHSGLTGEGTADFGQAAPSNSWATGTSVEVNSVYLRITADLPSTEGHVANAARGGASASALVGQVRAALQIVPTPQLAIIQTIDADIRCDGSDAAHVPEFGAALAAALDVISSASPNTKVLVVGQLGRPRAEFLEQLVARVPSVKAELSGDGMCDFYGVDGQLVPDRVAALTAVIDAYEAEQARVCATFPGCQTDGGVRAAYVDSLENFAPDWNHLNVRGQAAAAALIWPVVAETLGLAP